MQQVDISSNEIDLEELPIYKADKDCFLMKYSANQLAHFLYQNDHKRIGIIGPYGIGKTSFIHLLYEQLHKKENNLIPIFISSWGIPQRNIIYYIILYHK